MKDRINSNYLFIVYAIIVIVSSVIVNVSCSMIGIDNIEIDEILDIETVIVPEVDEPETEIIIEVAIEPIEEKIIMMKPIEKYSAYAVDDESGKVYGLNGKEKTLITVEDTKGVLFQFKDFFVKDGDIYFQTNETIIDNTDPENPTSEEVTHYFCQSDGEISEFVSADDYPDKPISSFLTMAEGNFQIVEKDGHSEVMRGTLRTAYVQIDGYFFTVDGLWFSVSETISIRKKGIYFYDNTINLSANPQFIGRVWKL